MPDLRHLDPVDPMYRAVYADGSTLLVRHGREAMTQEIREFAGARTPRPSAVSPTGSSTLYRARDGLVHRRQLRLAPRPDQAVEVRPRTRQLGGFGKLGKKVASFFDDERLQRIFSFQSMYAGLAPYEALALYAVITYMDSIDGVFVPEGGMHTMAPGPRRRGEQPRASRSATSSPVTASCVRRAGAVTGVDDRRRAGRRRRRRVQPRPARRLPRACSRDIDAPRRPLGRATTRRRAWCGSPVSRGCRLPTQPPQHPLRRRLGRLVQGPDRRWCPHARPVDPRHAAQPRRPVARPRRATRASTCSNPHRTSTARSTGRRSATRIVDLHARVAALGYPTDVEVERFDDPLDWERMGMERGTPFALCPHVPPDRTVPPEQRRQAGAGPRVHRFGHAAGRRRADGARLGQARRATRRPVRVAASLMAGVSFRRRPGRPRRRPSVPAGPVTLDESYERCRELNKRHGTTYYWST